MMDNELNRASSHRVVRLAEKFHSKEYRDTYVESHTRRFLAHQMRKFRGDKSQVEFGDILSKRQTIVWRLEDPNYSGWSLRTLFQVAQKLNVAVVARFVDFQTFLRLTDDTSESALNAAPYNEVRVDEFALYEAMAGERLARQSFYVDSWQANQGIQSVVAFPIAAPKALSCAVAGGTPLAGRFSNAVDAGTSFCLGSTINSTGTNVLVARQAFAGNVISYTSPSELELCQQLAKKEKELAEKDKEIASLRAANYTARGPSPSELTPPSPYMINHLQEQRLGA